MNKNLLVSIIIANYNGEKYLRICLNSVLKSSYRNFEVFLIDDGSTDNSVEIIRLYMERDKRLVFLKNEKNLGAAETRNKALSLVHGQIVIFLDNDTKVQDYWIEGLIEVLSKNPKNGAAQSVLIDYESKDRIQMAGGHLIPYVGWLAPFFQNVLYKEAKSKLDDYPIVAISAALAIKKKVLDKVKKFDSKEAIHTEDLDFCWRVWLSGYRITLAPKSVVYHWTKSMSKRTGMNTTPRKVYFHLAKNSFRSMLKNLELHNLIKYLPVSLLINLGRGIVSLFLRRDPSALIGTGQATLWNLIYLFDTLSERKKIQATRQISDQDLASEIFTKESPLSIYNRFAKISRSHLDDGDKIRFTLPQQIKSEVNVNLLKKTSDS